MFKKKKRILLLSDHRNNMLWICIFNTHKPEIYIIVQFKGSNSNMKNDCFVNLFDLLIKKNWFIRVIFSQISTEMMFKRTAYGCTHCFLNCHYWQIDFTFVLHTHTQIFLFIYLFQSRALVSIKGIVCPKWKVCHLHKPVWCPFFCGT